LRHRRRLNTQTIRKKRPTGTHPKLQSVKKKSSVGKFFKFLFYLLILAGLGYLGYTYLLPVLKLPSAEISGTETANPQAFPAEENTEPQTISETQPQLSPIKKKIQVEVLNGCGEQGIAKILGDRLINKEYDVVNSGNYIENGKTNFTVEQTKIIDQLNTPKNLAKAKDLAAFMGIQSSFVESFENPSPIADITIVIGKDFKTIPVFKRD